MRRSLPFTAVALCAGATLAACSWGIKLDSGGEKVRTDWNGASLAACRDLGKVTVSVLDHVGPVDRKDLKVRDELEVMARNEAAGMGADTIKPLGEPVGGEQSFSAYHCGVAAAARGDRPAMRIQQREPSNGDAVQTYPVDGH